MENKKIIAIVGATGVQGKGLIKSILNDSSGEFSPRAITRNSESEKAKGVQQNAIAGKKGGKIAKDARLALEQKTGKRIITAENFLPPATDNKKLNKKKQKTIRITHNVSSCRQGKR